MERTPGAFSGYRWLPWRRWPRAARRKSFDQPCWLAWKLARAGFGGPALDIAPSFWAGVALHPVNPKAYVQSVMVFSAFVAPESAYAPQAVILGALCLVTMMMATSLWGLGGDAIRLFVRDPRIMRFVAVAASLLMVVSVGAALIL